MTLIACCEPARMPYELRHLFIDQSYCYLLLNLNSIQARVSSTLSRMFLKVSILGFSGKWISIFQGPV